MKEQFIQTYAAEMKADCDSGKHCYVIPADGWEGLARRMVAGMLAGRANFSDAAKRACKKLGGKPTCAGVVEMISNG